MSPLAPAMHSHSSNLFPNFGISYSFNWRLLFHEYTTHRSHFFDFRKLDAAKNIDVLFSFLKKKNSAEGSFNNQRGINF